MKKNINKIFIANRGEIAARIIRTCNRLGITTVLGVSKADINSVPAALADQIVVLGPAPSSESYLNIDKVVAAAKKSGADALHPGYGFLSENSKLAQECEENDIIFIGPTVTQLEAIGDKLLARQNAIQANLSVVPGASVGGEPAKETEALLIEIGLPILIKAVSGGGGRGMKIVSQHAELESAMSLAMAEAEAAFGDRRVYLERYVANGRHVEVQILADGNSVIHLGTRDCSVQRRYQKVVEEAPAPNINPQLRDAIQKAAVRFAQYLNYRGLGTIEFLLDCELETFYFLEMNARVQVEHPVTEAITGIDLIEQQIRVAEGRPLGIKQADVAFNGHAFECRINAENCADNFSPSPGALTIVKWPAATTIRVDSHVETGTVVPPFYDSLIGKIIAYGKTRTEALENMKSALEKCEIQGVETNLELHKLVLNSEKFKLGTMNTALLEKLLQDGTFVLSGHSKSLGVLN